MEETRKNFTLLKQNGKNYFMTKVETLQDLQAFCETRYYKDSDIAFLWRILARGDTYEFCLTEEQFKKYYLGGDEK